ncbi:MAG: hypothetical protein WAO35_06315 [Terriglobia bacterium]
MRGILVLAILTVKSSYSRNIEIALQGADDIPDTLQWWFGGGGCWRIRTYAIDHDIHTFKIANSPQTTLELATKNNLKNYGDVMKAQHVIHFVNCTDSSELHAEFGQIGLAPRIEINPGRFAFWKPDEAVYLTKSTPKQSGHGRDADGW